MSEFTEEEKQKLFSLLEDMVRSNSEIVSWLSFVYGRQFEQAYNLAFQDSKEQDIFEAIDGSRSIRDIVDVTGHSKMIVQTRISWLSEKGFITKNTNGRYQHLVHKSEIARKFSVTEGDQNAGES